MKVPGNGFVTIYQFPMAAGCKLVSLTREGNENLVGLGLKGLQIIGTVFKNIFMKFTKWFLIWLGCK